MFYKRDYTKLTPEEILLWQKAELIIKNGEKDNGLISSTNMTAYFDTLPLAAQHARTLFPNNYLSTEKLKDNTELIDTKKEFETLLNSGAGEQQLLNFIRDKEAAFIPGSILKNYTFGHHIAFAFREFELPPYYKADFLLVGKSSMGYEFIFVEFESPTGNIINADGDFGTVIRKGLKQIEDWEFWIEANYSIMKLVYDKMLMRGLVPPDLESKINNQLPNEFFELDKTRIHFTVIAGRRKDFSTKAYRKKRKLFKDKNVLLLHYDNLLDNIQKLIQHGTY